MNENNLLVKRYNAARVTLGVVIGFIVYNSLMLLINPDVSTLFVVVIPQLALAYAHYYFSGLQAVLLVVLFVVFPLLLNIICFILSSKEHKWLLFAAFMMIVDAFGLGGFAYLYGFNIAMMLDGFVEVCLIYYLLRGAFAGKKLGDQFVIEETEEETEKVITVSSYRYDEQMAIQNKTKKGGMVVVAVIGFLASLVLAMFIVAVIATYNDLSAEAFAALLFGLLIFMFVLFVRAVLKLAPYTSAKSIQYFVLDGEVCRCINNDGQTTQMLKGLKIQKQSQSTFYCTFETQKGNTKKIVIPNCYPGLESILKK